MQSSFSRSFLFMLAGPIIWALHFLIIYGVNGVACARPGLHRTWLGFPVSSWIIVGASVVALAAIAIIYLSQRTRMPRIEDAGFLRWLAVALGLLSALAIVWETVPVLVLPACISG